MAAVRKYDILFLRLNLMTNVLAHGQKKIICLHGQCAFRFLILFCLFVKGNSNLPLFFFCYADELTFSEYAKMFFIPWLILRRAFLFL